MARLHFALEMSSFMYDYLRMNTRLDDNLRKACLSTHSPRVATDMQFQSSHSQRTREAELALTARLCSQRIPLDY